MNLLGEKLINASKIYKDNKNNADSFTEFFVEYVSEYIEFNTETCDIFERTVERVLNKISEIDRALDDNEILVLISELKKDLERKGLIKKDFDGGDIIGMIFLGNLINNTEENH